MPCLEAISRDVEMVPLQWLAYYVAKENKCDIDILHVFANIYLKVKYGK